MPYTLYKEPVQLETLAIVQYLHHCGISLLPSRVIKRCHPPELLPLPSIVEHDSGTVYRGLDGCVRFYEAATGIGNVLSKALVFKQQHPDYRIRDQR